jgi:hypothetical protein
MAAPAPREHEPIYIRDMMARLRIDANGGVAPRLGLRYATVFQRCRACTSTKICRDWLDRSPVAVNFVPRFCPNADILVELEFDQLGRGSLVAVKPSIALVASGQRGSSPDDVEGSNTR